MCFNCVFYEIPLPPQTELLTGWRVTLLFAFYGEQLGANGGQRMYLV